MSYLCYRPKWEIKITHTPSGESIILTSQYHKTMKSAHNVAIQILKSRLLMKSLLEPIDMIEDKK